MGERLIINSSSLSISVYTLCFERRYCVIASVVCLYTGDGWWDVYLT